MSHKSISQIYRSISIIYYMSESVSSNPCKTIQFLFPTNYFLFTEMATNTEGSSVLSSSHCKPFMIYDQPGNNQRGEDNKILGHWDRPVLANSMQGQGNFRLAWLI